MKKVRSRQDPKQNQSLAIRMALDANPTAKATEIINIVQKEHGHKVTPTLIYLVKSKTKLSGAKRPRRTRRPSVLTVNHQTVQTIKAARQLLNLAGSRPAASAILDALCE